MKKLLIIYTICLKLYHHLLMYFMKVSMESVSTFNILFLFLFIINWKQKIMFGNYLYFKKMEAKSISTAKK